MFQMFFSPKILSLFHLMTMTMEQFSNYWKMTHDESTVLSSKSHKQWSIGHGEYIKGILCSQKRFGWRNYFRIVSKLQSDKYLHSWLQVLPRAQVRGKYSEQCIYPLPVKWWPSQHHIWMYACLHVYSSLCTFITVKSAYVCVHVDYICWKTPHLATWPLPLE